MRARIGLITALGCLALACDGTGVLEAGLPTVPPSDLPVVGGKPGVEGGGCRGTYVSSIQGQLVAEDGLGRPGIKAQLCIRDGISGGLTCLPPVDSAPDGSFLVTVPQDTQCIGGAAMRVLLPGQAAATSYCNLDLTSAPTVRLGAPMVVYGMNPPASRPDLGDPMRPHAVDFGNGLEVDVVPGQLYGGVGQYEALAARALRPDAQGLCFPAEVAAFDGLYAFSPEVDVEGAGFTLRVRTDQPPLTAVALYAFGGLGCTDAAGRLMPETGWTDFGTGIVGNDGYVHVDAQNALPCLSWLGYKAIRGGEDRAPPPPGAVPEEDDLPPIIDAPDGREPEPGAPPPPTPPGEPEAPAPQPEPEPQAPQPQPEPEPQAQPEPEPQPPTGDGDCAYPPAGGLSLGGVMPNLSWPDAVDQSGQAVGFTLEDFHCDPAYARFNTVTFVVSAGWCGACPQYLSQVGPQLSAIDQAGGLVVFVEAEDRSYNPVDSRTARQYFSRYIGNGPGLTVGGGSSTPQRAISQSGFIRSFPSAFAVRRRDMRVIAELRSTPGGFDIAAIARDPERDWGAGAGNGGGGGGARCGPEDEEPSEPNDTAATAGVVRAGESFDGGICDGNMDFYSIQHAGAWQLDLEFRHSDGDIDVYVWDPATNQPLQQNGSRIGADSGNDNERFTHQGNAIIGVLGYRGATAPYRLTLTAR